MSEKTDRILKTPEGKFQVMSLAGKPLGDPFDTEREANERLREIEAAVAARERPDAASRFDDEAWEAYVLKTEDEYRATVDSMKAYYGAKLDSTVQRIDYLGAIHLDPKRTDGILAVADPKTGFLKIDAHLTRTGVFTYGDRHGNTWGELRTADEVFSKDALKSFEMVVLTNDHPAEFVTTANVKDVSVGVVGSDVRRDGDFVSATIIVQDASTIALIRDGKTELSCGYTVTVVSDEGETADGTPFSGRHTDIRGNHVAIVDQGRAGPQCRLLVDSGSAFAFTHTQKVPMTDKKKTPGVAIQIGDNKVTVDASVAAHIEQLKADAAKELEKALDAAKKPKKGVNPFAESPDDEDDKDAKKGDGADKAQDAAAVQGRLDMLETQASVRMHTENARIDARVELVTAARTVLGKDTKTTGVSDEALMRAVVLDVQPTIKDRLDANAKRPGYLTAAFDAAMDLHRVADQAENALGSAVFDAMNDGGDGKINLDQAHADMCARRHKISFKETGAEA